ncbi:MAG: cell division topological specificity factor MinE [Clostridia bacterium]|nr:cell division topological specificity factor MinE [Clostridia bacterium]
MNFFRNLGKSDKKENNSRDTAKERLHLVLMQDRANVSADFLDLMRQEIIEVIKKYVEVDESEIDVRMTNKQNDDGSNGAPALYANIPIVNIKNDILVEKKKAAEAAKVENVRVETVEQIAENNGGNQEEIVIEEYREENNEPIQEEIAKQETVNN